MSGSVWQKRLWRKTRPMMTWAQQQQKRRGFFTAETDEEWQAWTSAIYTDDFRRRGIPEWLLRAELRRLFCASRGASSLVARSLLALLHLEAATAASTGEARGEREREGRIMNLQIAPSWMKNTRLDESRSDYGLDNDPLMDEKL